MARLKMKQSIFLFFLFAFLSIIPTHSFAATIYFDVPPPSSSDLRQVDSSQCGVAAQCANTDSNSTSNAVCGLNGCGGGVTWTKYQLTCFEQRDPETDQVLDYKGYYQQVGDRVYSIGDKCIPGETGLRPGYCGGNYGGMYKRCCQGSTPVSCVQASSIYQDGNDPSEGACPSGSFETAAGVTSCPIAAPTCNNNGVQDNGESGIDCGGGGCSACQNTPTPDWTVTCCDGSTDKLSNPPGPFSSYNQWATEACLDNQGYESCNTGGTPHIPQGSCSVQQNCNGGNCTFNINYNVDNSPESNFITTLRPDTSSTVTRDFSAGQTVQWTYQSGTYTASVRVRKTDGSAETNCQTQPFVIDLIAPTCNSLTLSSNTVQQGTDVTITASVSDNVQVASIELFRSGTRITNPFYNTLNQKPTYDISYKYQTNNLTPGTYTIAANAIDTANPGNVMSNNPTVANAIDTANPGNVMSNNPTCTKQLTITQPTWIPKQCSNGVFSGCKLQGGSDCSDAGPGSPPYSNWNQTQGNLCQQACPNGINTPVATRNQSCRQDSISVSPNPVTKTNNQWAQVTVSPIMGTVNSGNIKIKSGTHTTTGNCSGTLCQGWATVRDNVSSSTTSFNWNPNTNPNITQGAYTFALFTTNNGAILATDTINFSINQICTPGERRNGQCTTNACTL